MEIPTTIYQMETSAHDGADDVAINNTDTVGGGGVDAFFNENSQSMVDADKEEGDFHTIIGDVSGAERNIIGTTQLDTGSKQDIVLLSKKVLLEIVDLLVKDKKLDLFLLNTVCLPKLLWNIIP